MPLNVTLRAAAAACLFFVATISPAQQEPSEVTDGEIAKYKALARTGCNEGGTARGDAKEKVEAFCTCVLERLEKSMTRAEWQQAYFYSIRKDDAGEKKVLAPHVQQLGECRPR